MGIGDRKAPSGGMVRACGEVSGVGRSMGWRDHSPVGSGEVARGQTIVSLAEKGVHFVFATCNLKKKEMFVATFWSQGSSSSDWLRTGAKLLFV
jgi:hypothetical protein